jgi:RimJ/RimL family protein N-acetyltransferase
MLPEKRTLLQTDRLSFRPFTESDFDSMRSLDTDPAVVRYLGHGRIREVVETRKNFERVFADYAQYGIGLYAAESMKTREFLGRTGLIPWILDGELVWEIGYSFLKKFWGQGLATEAASFWKAYGFEHLSVSFLVSLINADNRPSIHVAEKIGMHFWKQSELGGCSLSVYRIEKGFSAKNSLGSLFLGA